VKKTYVALVTCGYCHLQLILRHAWLDDGAFDHHVFRLHLRLCNG